MDDNDLIMRGSLPFRDDIKIPSIYGLGDGLWWFATFFALAWQIFYSQFVVFGLRSPAAAHPGILNPPTRGFLLWKKSPFLIGKYQRSKWAMASIANCWYLPECKSYKQPFYHIGHIEYLYTTSWSLLLMIPITPVKQNISNKTSQYSWWKNLGDIYPLYKYPTS